MKYSLFAFALQNFIFTAHVRCAVALITILSNPTVLRCFEFLKCVIISLSVRIFTISLSKMIFYLYQMSFFSLSAVVNDLFSLITIVKTLQIATYKVNNSMKPPSNTPSKALSFQ